MGKVKSVGHKHFLLFIKVTSIFSISHNALDLVESEMFAVCIQVYQSEKKKGFSMEKKNVIKHFLLFPTTFSKGFFLRIYTTWACLIYPSLQSRALMTLDKKLFENIVGKGENAGNQQFLFPTIFSFLSRKDSYIQSIFS